MQDAQDRIKDLVKKLNKYIEDIESEIETIYTYTGPGVFSSYSPSKRETIEKNYDKTALNGSIASRRSMLAKALKGNLLEILELKSSKDLKLSDDLKKVIIDKKSQTLCFYVIAAIAQYRQIASSSDSLDSILKNASKHFKKADPENFRKAEDFYENSEIEDLAKNLDEYIAIADTQKLQLAAELKKNLLELKSPEDAKEATTDKKRRMFYFYMIAAVEKNKQINSPDLLDKTLEDAIKKFDLENFKEAEKQYIKSKSDIPIMRLS